MKKVNICNTPKTKKILKNPFVETKRKSRKKKKSNHETSE